MMIEVLFGFLLGVVFAIFMPDSFEKIKLKIMALVYRDHKCKEDKPRDRHYR